ncbi:hypothetical protein OG604_40115 [Streptomyces sp. NBC_01231]|nr:hypothetical protein OG604_40115 [Streptomyces sp. NBC_01231]
MGWETVSESSDGHPGDRQVFIIADAAHSLPRTLRLVVRRDVHG